MTVSVNIEKSHKTQWTDFKRNPENFYFIFSILRNPNMELKHVYRFYREGETPQAIKELLPLYSPRVKSIHSLSNTHRPGK